MKSGKLLLTATFVCFLNIPVFAATDTSKQASPEMAVQKVSPATIKNVWPELILRPIGVLSSAIGAGLFVATAFCSPRYRNKD